MDGRELIKRLEFVRDYEGMPESVFIARAWVDAGEDLRRELFAHVLKHYHTTCEDGHQRPLVTVENGIMRGVHADEEVPPPAPRRKKRPPAPPGRGSRKQVARNEKLVRGALDKGFHTVPEIVEFSGLSERTVYRTLNKIGARHSGGKWEV